MSTANPSPDDLLTTEEVAEIFRVPVATIRKWRNERTGPPGFRVGKYVRYRRSAVDLYISDLENRR